MAYDFYRSLFQHTAARRRLQSGADCQIPRSCFNTQPPEGGWVINVSIFLSPLSFNTQPPEGGCGASVSEAYLMGVSTHSRPKAADGYGRPVAYHIMVSTHSRPKAAAADKVYLYGQEAFQHTAARRRLGGKRNQYA